MSVLNVSETSTGGSLPKSIKKLTALTALVAKQAGLTDLQHVHKLHSLTTLVVSDNQLGSLPTSLRGLTSLTKLSASRCGLTTLPDLSALPLVELRLSNNSLGSLPADHLPTSLQTVSISSCGLKALNGLAPLRSSLQLTNLDVHDNVFSVSSNDPGYDKYKSKVRMCAWSASDAQMLNFIPSLRILDGNRFDEAFIARKAKKAARKAELAQEGVVEPATKKRRKSELAAETTEEEPGSLLGGASLFAPQPEENIEAPSPVTVPLDGRQKTSVVSITEIKQPKRRKQDQAQLDAVLGIGKTAKEASSWASELNIGTW